MSLSVDVWLPAEGGQLEILTPAFEGADLAGFERWRMTVWGSEAVRALGARFFPVLADGDLTVQPDQMDAFLAECALIRASVELIAPRSDPGESIPQYVEQISARLANIEAAAERAQQLGGGLVIW